MAMKSIPLYTKILIGMALGIVIGLIATNTGCDKIITNWIKPFGDIFMRLLKLIAIPLILISLLKGVGNLNNIRSLSTIGVRTMLIYICTTVIAILLGLGLVELFAPGKMVSPDSAAQLQSIYEQSTIQNQQIAQTISNQSPLQPLVDIFPDNMMGAMSTNSNMLQVIFIAIILGIAILLVGKERSAPVIKLVDSLDAIVLKVVDIIMIYAPIGVFALMSAMVVDSAGDFSLLGALGYYALTVILGLLMMIFIVYPTLLKIFTKSSLRHFFRSMMPVQLLAFSTSSSAATLPLTMETVETKLGVSNRTASFVLPVGVTINMDGTSCYQAIAAVFIAQVLGIDLGWQELLILVATTTISSIGTPGVPGGSIVILVMVLGSVGIPAEGLALILGMDRPLDMLRTVVNVTGDATVATIVDTTVKDE